MNAVRNDPMPARENLGTPANPTATPARHHARRRPLHPIGPRLRHAAGLFLWYAGVVFAADPLTDLLQQGLLEEEVHRDLPAAVRAYEAAVRLADSQHQTAATVTFRLGETYRKLGRTNDAIAQYQRVLANFADQTPLVTASRQNLSDLGSPVEARATALSDSAEKRKQLLEQELALVLQQLDSKKRQIGAGAANPDDLIPIEREILALRRQIIEVESSRVELLEIPLGPKPPAEAKNSDALRAEIRLVAQQVAAAEARAADRSSPGEAQRARLELLRLQRQLPENQDPPRQRALISQAISACQQYVTNLAVLAEAGRIPGDDLVQARRELVRLEGELAALTSASASDPAGSATEAAGVDPADVESLNQEIQLVDQEILAIGKRIENGKSELSDLRKARRERLALMRRLPDQADPASQVALLKEELKLVEENLEEVRRKITVGVAPPADEVPAQRELLSVQRELRAAERRAAASLPGTTGSTAKPGVRF